MSSGTPLCLFASHFRLAGQAYVSFAINPDERQTILGSSNDHQPRRADGWYDTFRIKRVTSASGRFYDALVAPSRPPWNSSSVFPPLGAMSLDATFSGAMVPVPMTVEPYVADLPQSFDARRLCSMDLNGSKLVFVSAELGGSYDTALRRYKNVGESLIKVLLFRQRLMGLYGIRPTFGTPIKLATLHVSSILAQDIGTPPLCSTTSKIIRFWTGPMMTCHFPVSF